MKLYNEPIEVEVDADKRPVTIYWRRRTLAVKAIEEEWTYDGKWWTTPNLEGIHRDYYRLSCAGLGRGAGGRTAVGLEIYRESRPTESGPTESETTVREAWMLSRVVD